MKSFLWFIGIAVVLSGGCGPSDPRLAISGSVQFAGQPLAAGTIEFAPVGSGGQAGASINDGRFDIPAARGLPPGDYLVRITAAPVSLPTAMPPGPPGPESMKKPAAAADEIPAKYNSETELTVTVAKKSDNEFEFLLER